MECPLCSQRKDDVSFCVPCGHIFCTVCLDRHMLVEKDCCPNCKAQNVIVQRVCLDSSKDTVMKRLLNHVEKGSGKTELELFFVLCLIFFYQNLVFEAIRLMLTLLLIFWICSFLVLALTCLRTGGEFDLVLLFKAGSIDISRKLSKMFKILQEIYSYLSAFAERSTNK
ncbi:hypothetical protein ACJMK2_037064 [Sinanodonta woodiana]|uniref:RING-type domain-containing protein n=1 Tax=Sinanodonta woodiana TaxID=1069815 RepID=A0ABD3WKE6_SINWO